MSRFSVGKLPGWAKTKLAAEDNAGQVILVSVVPNSIFGSLFLVSFPHIFFSLRTKRGPGSPVGQKGASSSLSRCTLCHLLPAHTIDIVNNQKGVFSNFDKGIEVCCFTIVSLAAA